MISLEEIVAPNVLSLTDDDEQPDYDPSKDFLKVYKAKLRELSDILEDVYPPAESYKINEKLTQMGQVPLFVSRFQEL